MAGERGKLTDLQIPAGHGRAECRALLAKWADVDLDGAQWHIPKSKTGAAMGIPLAPIVVDWFRELHTLAGSSAYVLPAHSSSRAARHGGDTHLNKDMLREAIDHWLRTANRDRLRRCDDRLTHRCRGR